MTTEAEFLTSYEKIKISYKNVMKCLDQAISLEENEHPIEAIKAYSKAVLLIDETFAIPVGLPDNLETVEPEWNDACSTIHKMKSAKSETLHRLKILQSKHGTVEVSANGSRRNSAYAVQSSPTLFEIKTNTGLLTTYKEILQGFRNVLKSRESGITFDVLFHSTAKLYKIQPDGIVSTIEGDTEMSVVLCSCTSEKWIFLNGIYFIQCTLRDTSNGQSSSTEIKNMMWIYPLVPQITDCFRTEYGAFIFPDMETTVPGTAFGIIIPNDNDSQQFMLDLLEAILAGEIRQIKDPYEKPTPQDTSAKVSKNIVGAADFIARNLIKGAEKTGELMVSSTPYLISKLAPASSTDQPVSSKLQTTVGIAKGATSAAASVTGWVAGKVGTASVALGRYLSPHIQTHGATLLEKGLGYKNDEAQEKMQGALTIAAGAVEGFTTVYGGLEDSAKILGNNLSNNSVKIIEHKYGPSAGVVASDTFETLGNAFNVSRNVNYITPKGLAKGMAKNTGKAVFVDYRKGIREESHYVQAGDLYPDLRKLKDINQN